MVKHLLIWIFTVSALQGICSAEGFVTGILRKVEKINTLDCDLTARISLIQERARQGMRERELVYHRRDSDDAFLLAFLAPEREKGNGYLRVEDNMWMYRRNTRTFQHIDRSDRIGDSMISAETFETRKLTQLYAPVLDVNGQEIYEETVLGKIPVYKFEIEAIVNDVSYPKHIYWVRRDNFLLLKQESYSMSGTLMQTVYFTKYTRIQDRYFPVKFLFVDEFEKGNRNLGTVSGISLKPVENSLFTKAYLENLSK
jgi:hypothetical protein